MSVLVTLAGIWGSTLIGGDRAMAGTKAEAYFEGVQLDLVRALQNGDSEAVKRSLKAGADVNRPGRDGVVPYLYFVANNDASAMVRLYKLGAKFDYKLPHALGPSFPELFGWIPANRDTTVLKALLEAGLDANYRPDGDWPLIYWTITPVNRPALALLLKFGADINAQDDLGSTVLHNAIEAERYDVARYLVERGARPNVATTRGKTALDYLRQDKARFTPGSPIAHDVDDLLAWLASKGFR